RGVPLRDTRTNECPCVGGVTTEDVGAIEGGDEPIALVTAAPLELLGCILEQVLFSRLQRAVKADPPLEFVRDERQRNAPLEVVRVALGRPEDRITKAQALSAFALARANKEPHGPFRRASRSAMAWPLRPLAGACRWPRVAANHCSPSSRRARSASATQSMRFAPSGS